MNITTIKAQIAKHAGIEIPNLMMVRQFAEDKITPQPWVSHWDNTNRVRVTMHEDVFNKIKAAPSTEGFAFKYELVPAKGVENTPEFREAYHRYIVIEPKNVEATF